MIVLYCTCLSDITVLNDVTDITNYQPISRLSFLGKMFELIVLNHIQRPILSTILVDQHGFFSNQLTFTSAIDFMSSAHDVFLWYTYLYFGSAGNWQSTPNLDEILSFQAHIVHFSILNLV